MAWSTELGNQSCIEGETKSIIYSDSQIFSSDEIVNGKQSPWEVEEYYKWSFVNKERKSTQSYLSTYIWGYDLKIGAVAGDYMVENWG